MSHLSIYQDQQHDKIRLRSDLPLEISELLRDHAIVAKHIAWHGNVNDLLHHADQQRDLKREIVPLDRQHQFPFSSMAVVDDNYPNYDRLRLKYLSEHSFDKDEILYVLEGELLISFHSKQQVLQLFCQGGDMVLLPGGVARWLDVGSLPNRLVLMRVRQQEQEQILHYTGSNIADLFPRLD